MFFKCLYHANVIKIFDASSRRMVFINVFSIGNCKLLTYGERSHNPKKIIYESLLHQNLSFFLESVFSIHSAISKKFSDFNLLPFIGTHLLTTLAAQRNWTQSESSIGTQTKKSTQELDKCSQGEWRGEMKFPEKMSS